MIFVSTAERLLLKKYYLVATAKTVFLLVRINTEALLSWANAAPMEQKDLRHRC